MTLNPLDHSLPFDLNLITPHEVAERMYEAIDMGGYRKSRLPQLQVLLANLIAHHNTDAALYTAVSLAHSYYTPRSRYNSLGIGKGLIGLIQDMTDGGWLELHRGFRDAKTGVSRRSRIKPTNNLISLLENLEALALLIAYAPNTECIIQRDENRHDLEYRDTSDVIDSRITLTAYNNLLHKTLIDHPTFPEDGVPLKDGRVFKISPSQKFVRRIYNRSSFEWSGRFYGGWWQRIPKEHRQGIHINGQPTCEIDFSTIHIVLLYALEGIDYWRDIGTDAYLLDDYEHSDQLRTLLKLVVLIAVNARDRDQSLLALKDTINRRERDEYAWVREGNYDLEQILDLFVLKHHPIEHRFFSSDEFSLMNMDAEITEIIINKFTRNDIPILAIHDSFLISHMLEETLKVTMQGACRDVTSTRLGKAVVKTKVKFEGRDISGFEHLWRTDRDFFIDVVLKPSHSIEEQSRQADAEVHRNIVGSEDYYV